MSGPPTKAWIQQRREQARAQLGMAGLGSCCAPCAASGGSCGGESALAGLGAAGDDGGMARIVQITAAGVLAGAALSAVKSTGARVALGGALLALGYAWGSRDYGG